MSRDQSSLYSLALSSRSESHISSGSIKQNKHPTMSHFNESIKPTIHTPLPANNADSLYSPHDQKEICSPPPLPPKYKFPTMSSNDNKVSSQHLPPLQAKSFPDSQSVHHHTSPIITPRKDNPIIEDYYEDVSFALKQNDQSQVSYRDSLPFLKLVEQYQNHFPIAFEVVLGFSFDDVSISEGERFIAHFLKQTKMFTIQDETGHQYSIPYNSSFQFSLLHNPNNNMKEALSGFIFKTAGDIMISRTLPKLIRAGKSFRGIGPKSCISANELLIVKEVTQIDGERRILRCIELSSGKEKHLHQECFGEFSTAPYAVKVYLPQILPHFQLPLVAQMCIGQENEEEIPAHLASAVVILSIPRIEESLITSSITDDAKYGKDFVVPDKIGDSTIFIVNEIPLSFDIYVKPITVTPLNAENLLKLTDELYDSFHPSTVFSYLANCSTSQLALIKSVRNELEDSMVGVTLIESKALQEMRLNKKKPLIDIPGGIYLDPEIMNRIERLEYENKILKKTLKNVIGRPLDIDSSPAIDSITLWDVHHECTKLKIELDNLREMVSKLTKHGKYIIAAIQS